MFDRQRGEDNEDEEEDKQDKDRSYNDKTGGKSSDPNVPYLGVRENWVDRIINRIVRWTWAIFSHI
jgi:hypothetical protein